MSMEKTLPYIHISEVGKRDASICMVPYTDFKKRLHKKINFNTVRNWKYGHRKQAALYEVKHPYKIA
jgi:hypothetical protein